MDMMREFVRRSKYHPDMEKLRELLSKVTDEQKLNILQQTKNRWGITALCEAAWIDDAEMITTILSSLQSSDRLKVLMMIDNWMLTPLHTAAIGNMTESVKAILNSLTAVQQIQLLTAEGGRLGKTAVEMAAGETADVLIRYSMNAIRETRKGKIYLPITFCFSVLLHTAIEHLGLLPNLTTSMLLSFSK